MKNRRSFGSNMAPAVFEDGQYGYVQERLRILSGFYGVVKPMDGVVPYRLEMQAKAAVGGHKNLYVSPASLVNWKVTRLFRRVFTPKNPY